MRRFPPCSPEVPSCHRDVHSHVRLGDSMGHQVQSHATRIQPKASKSGSDERHQDRQSETRTRPPEPVDVVNRHPVGADLSAINSPPASHPATSAAARPLEYRATLKFQ